jgi:hypothetical protein
LYNPPQNPVLIDVPEMVFVAVHGKGDPNEADGEYSHAISVLYSILYTIKMSKKSGKTPDAYFDYVVPPLEGIWWSAAGEHSAPKDKSNFSWASMIRLPDFVTPEVFEWACNEASRKKKIDTTKAHFIQFTEGLCVQCMHIGSFDDEALTTVPMMHKFIENNNLTLDITDTRRHHEIYLSDPRKSAPEKMKTVIRLPVASSGKG